MKRMSQLACALGLVAGIGLTGAVPAFAEAPAKKGEINGKTLYLKPGSWLRYSDALVSRVYTTAKATLEVKGRDACTNLLCPVYHNNVELWALRTRLDLTKPDGATIVTERTLRKGDEGSDVKVMQEALAKGGFKTKVDGSFGDDTKSAVEAFQQKNNLDIDGDIGPATRAKLKV